MGFTRNNHYIPSVYLKHFADAEGKTFMYRLLVSRPQVEVWKRAHISAVGYHRDLYTRLALGTESDAFDAWLSREFETPAEPVLSKVHANEEITASDLKVLVRFAACQSVRVPAFLIKMLPIWNQRMPTTLDEVIADAKARYIWARITGEDPPPTPDAPRLKDLPIRIRQENLPEERSVRFVTELIIGRGFWLSTMEMLLTYTVKRLQVHHWSILHAAPGVNFFTSDNPVVKANYRGPGDYDFDGAWGSKGTMILFPLTPRHLLYTQVGEYLPSRGLLLRESETRDFRKMIAEHAHRYIFALSPDPEVLDYCPRKVNPVQVENERREWEKWNDEQIKPESQISATLPSVQP